MLNALFSRIVTLPLASKATMIAAIGVVSAGGIGGVLTHQTYEYQERPSITYNTKYVDDDTKLTGVQELVSAGSDGVRVITYQVTKADGIQLSKKILNDVVEKAPIEAVIKMGVLDKSTSLVNEQIAFAQQRVNDTSMQLGLYKVTQNGVNGTKQRTYEVISINGVEKSRTLTKEEVILQPIPQITADGVNYRVGATCRDGWPSSATGSGACSHHGGVLTWLMRY